MFSFLKTFLSSPLRSGKDKQASVTSPPCLFVVDEKFKKPIDVEKDQMAAEAKTPITWPRFPIKLFEESMDEENKEDIDVVTTDDKTQTATPLVIDELLDESMEAVTSTLDDNIGAADDRVDYDHDWEVTYNVRAPVAGTRDGYDQWKMEERKLLAQHFVRKERKALERLKEANQTATKYKLPNKFWPKCAECQKKKGYHKTSQQCRNEAFVISKFSKDDMKNNFDLNEEEADLLFGLWHRKKQQTKRAKKKGATVPVEWSKETWIPEEEAEFASYLVRDRKEDLEQMIEGRKVFHFFSDCSKHFDQLRSKNAYRNKAKKMRGYDNDTLKNIHKLTDDEIDLFRKPWLGNKK